MMRAAVYARVSTLWTQSSDSDSPSKSLSYPTEAPSRRARRIVLSTIAPTLAHRAGGFCLGACVDYGLCGGDSPPGVRDRLA